LAGRLGQGALQIAVEVTKGLGYAHAERVGHGDLTPCTAAQVKVLGFGMAHAFGREEVLKLAQMPVSATLSK
jgi:hypothetical protein